MGTRRDILQLGGQYILGDWTFSTNIRHEHREGTLEESLRATYGGMAFTMPVDYDTDRFDLSAAYNLPDFQALIQYTYSRFTDNNLAVSLPFPVSGTASLSASSGPYAQTALYSAPPSNSAHYVTAMLVDKVSPGTRITLNGRFGVELQNSMFPANSADPNLSSTLGNPTYTWFQHLNSLNQGTSATSPDAVAWVYQGNFTVTSNLATDLDGSASYSFDGRNVHLNQYQVWIGGSSPDCHRKHGGLRGAAELVQADRKRRGRLPHSAGEQHQGDGQLFIQRHQPRQRPGRAQHQPTASSCS